MGVLLFFAHILPSACLMRRDGVFPLAAYLSVPSHFLSPCPWKHPRHWREHSACDGLWVSFQSSTLCLGESGLSGIISVERLYNTPFREVPYAFLENTRDL